MVEHKYTPIEGPLDPDEAKRVLDLYDFSDTLRKLSKPSGTRLFKIQNAIADINDELSDAIDSLSEDELIDYLEESYKVWFLAHTEYKMCEIYEYGCDSLKFEVE